MPYVTSRKYPIPRRRADFKDFFAFNLWKIRLWPYKELLPGDTLYWYVASEDRLVLRSRVERVERFAFGSKNEVRNTLNREFGEFDLDQSYYRDAAEAGYCIAFSVDPVEFLDIPKPLGFKFPRQGWMKADESFNNEWFGRRRTIEEPTLDMLAGVGDPLQALGELSVAMRGVSPVKLNSVIEHTVRKDTKLIRAIKRAAGYRCQFPGCESRIVTKSGSVYVEVAHVDPVAKGGKSVIGNLIVLCPNHHKEFDLGDLKIESQSSTQLAGTLNGRPFIIAFPGAAKGRTE